MEGGQVLLERQRARVDGGRRGVLVDDEAVVDIGLDGAEGEGSVAAGLDDGVGEGRGAAGGDAAVVDGEVLVSGEGDDGAFDGVLAGEVEVSVGVGVSLSVTLVHQKVKREGNTYEWLVMLITVSSTSPSKSSASYSMPSRTFSLPSSLFSLLTV